MDDQVIGKLVDLLRAIGVRSFDPDMAPSQLPDDMTIEDMRASVFSTAVCTGMRIQQTHPELAEQILDRMMNDSTNHKMRSEWTNYFDSWFTNAVAEAMSRAEGHFSVPVADREH